jgi:ATP-dependent helicase Lhr and Lhr-like helicase
VPWRDVYYELKRLEYRGEVRRGYFVRGLAGAQFALPDAVEMLREAATPEPALVVMAADDPANPYSLALAPGVESEPLTRPRGRGSLLVTRAGAVMMSAEARGRRVRIRHDAASDDVTAAAAALAAAAMRAAPGRKRRDLVIEQIDGQPAAGSRWVDAFVRAGFRQAATSLRFYAAVS